MKTIGLISAGDMGVALGTELRRTGRPVVTTTRGRSGRCEENCRVAGLEVVASPDEVVARADVLLSCVPPNAALEVARQIGALLKGRERSLLYIDLNSIAPSTVEQVEEAVRRDCVTFADATIHGTSQRLRDLAVLYASGRGAADAIDLFAPIFRTENLGPICGRASAFKMLLGAVSKSLVAVIVEVGCVAGRQELLAGFLDACRTFYPGLMQALDRTLLTYPQHAARRAVELVQVEKFFLESGVEPAVIGAARRVIAHFAASELCLPTRPDAASTQDLLSRAQIAGVCDEASTRQPREPKGNEPFPRSETA